MAVRVKDGNKEGNIFKLYILHEHVHDIDVDTLDDFREDMMDVIWSSFAELRAGAQQT